MINEERKIDQRTWTKQDELKLINDLQDEYVDKLADLIESINTSDAAMKHLNLTAPTGTGKTKMMAKLINKYPNAFFIITTLSKGQLNQQVANSLYNDCFQDNFIVFGAMSLKVNTILTEDDVLRMLPDDKDIYWLRDEGHINTNNWEKVLEARCRKIINVSATNKIAYGIECDFTETMMLRTVHQMIGNIKDALDKLKDIKKKHKVVKHYNPCAIFRVNSTYLEQQIIEECKKYKYKVISLIDNDDYNMKDLCNDDNKYDVIINKQKIVEGIDIRRAHIIWMESKPKNAATTIQQIGRCRRNALLWRDDIDILAPENKELLNHTRQCFIYYNICTMNDMKDIDDELYLDLCPIISIEKLHAGYTIYVENGVMSNGLFIAELEGKTGFFTISKDEETGFNVVDNRDIYLTKMREHPINYQEINLLIDSMFNKDFAYFQHKIDLWSSQGYDYVHLMNEGKIYYIKINKLIKRLNSLIYKINNGKNDRESIIREITYGISANVDNAGGIFSSRLLTILGIENFTQHKTNQSVIWLPEKNVTAKIASNTKFNQHIEKIYFAQIKQARKQIFTGRNLFSFEKQYNSCLGYCVEYYAKYLLYGQSYLGENVTKDMMHCNLKSFKEEKNLVIIRACLLKYKDDMRLNFGEEVYQKIKVPTVNTLRKPEAQDFVNAVIELGTKTADFIREHINVEEAKNTSPFFNTKHIIGLADFVSKDTIIDLKCTNHINLQMVRQVLGYHFLSQFRSDLDIKKVIVYDAVSGRFIEINIP